MVQSSQHIMLLYRQSGMGSSTLSGSLSRNTTIYSNNASWNQINFRTKLTGFESTSVLLNRRFMSSLMRTNVNRNSTLQFTKNWRQPNSNRSVQSWIAKRKLFGRGGNRIKIEEFTEIYTGVLTKPLIRLKWVSLTSATFTIVLACFKLYLMYDEDDWFKNFTRGNVYQIFVLLGIGLMTTVLLHRFTSGYIISLSYNHIRDQYLVHTPSIFGTIKKNVFNSNDFTGFSNRTLANIVIKDKHYYIDYADSRVVELIEDLVQKSPNYESLDQLLQKKRPNIDDLKK